MPRLSATRRLRAQAPMRALPPRHPLAAAARRWLRAFERRVRAVDFAGAAPMFARDVAAFGTRAAIVAGRAALRRRQWSKIWPRIGGFRFRMRAMRCLGTAEGLCVIVPWDSRGVRADGTVGARPGRATLLLVRRAGRWVALHSHFSLAPASPSRPRKRARPRPRRSRI